ncbi:hypothetical protein J2858_000774 [Neorhizobium galegae]|uniref:hypothetical protein n=1 Tax=Neorhizobium galegae TaxID=399 RepID=UPI001AE653B5|nr:hypothetical protein [Neorhizobium galegae]MBP2547881.1 hypothetical protein [Neorhizobium galegae]
MRHIARLFMVVAVLLQGMMPVLALQPMAVIPTMALMPHHAAFSSAAMDDGHAPHGPHHAHATQKMAPCPGCKPMPMMNCCAGAFCAACLSPLPVPLFADVRKTLPLSYPASRVAQMRAGAPDPLVPPPRA